ncbi:glycoside hydrolase family 47 protein [Sphingomonas sp. PR090111-T3T-6A]|uniref:glycoside hydrolase family 47 protein n=1 Tax=Sphingomonas sp. PR090111-T3T-6A TaxID=685778 RepID=UPI00039BD86D|nr:glycoside hydrolase family 47 protein [Sphingomonas sp. PR090111-T3T-6A]
MRIGRRGMMMGAVALWGEAGSAATTGSTGTVDWSALGQDVKAQMAWAWDQYKAHAWGKDELKPVSGTYSSFPLSNGRHLGLSLVEALDTLWVMGLDSRFEEGVDWVKANLDFDVDGDVSVFETSIRLVGGLLSAHHACDDPGLLAKAKDLADRLLPAFHTPTGMPWGFINLKTGAVRESTNSPAGIATYWPEWGTLSRLTGDARYGEAARKATVAVFERRSKLDLVATSIDVLSGEWKSRTATIDPYGDSFFEYLWDGWQLFGDAEWKRMYDICTAAILKRQRVWKAGELWFADVDFETGQIVTTEQNELASFYGGLLGQGGAMRDGAAYTESWSKVQDRYGVLPEGYDYASARPTETTNALRPELADSAFTLWLLDRNPRWREIGRTHFLNMKRWNKTIYGYTDLADVTSNPKRQADHCPGYWWSEQMKYYYLLWNKTIYGYTDLADVTSNPKRQADHCPGYWWSEQMKYYYLLFSDTPRFDYKRNYLSTEGNVLLGFKRGD